MRALAVIAFLAVNAAALAGAPAGGGLRHGASAASTSQAAPTTIPSGPRAGSLLSTHLRGATVTAVGRELIHGREVRVVTLSTTPITQAERTYLLQHDYRPISLEPHAEVWCPDHLVSNERNCFRMPRRDSDDDDDDG
jgi:hypothetical protein